jgi:hypothetical protein
MTHSWLFLFGLDNRIISTHNGGMSRIPDQHIIHLESFREEMQLVLASGPTKGGGHKRLLLTFKQGAVGYRLTEKDGATRYQKAKTPRHFDDFELAVDAYNER